MRIRSNVRHLVQHTHPPWSSLLSCLSFPYVRLLVLFPCIDFCFVISRRTVPVNFWPVFLNNLKNNIYFPKVLKYIHCLLRNQIDCEYHLLKTSEATVIKHIQKSIKYGSWWNRAKVYSENIDHVFSHNIFRSTSYFNELDI